MVRRTHVYECYTCTMNFTSYIYYMYHLYTVYRTPLSCTPTKEMLTLISKIKRKAQRFNRARCQPFTSILHICVPSVTISTPCHSSLTLLLSACTHPFLP